MMKLFLALALFGFTQVAQSASGDIPTIEYRVVNVFPHDPNAFTQGLFFRDGVLYESTGMRGSSSIRRVELETGKVVMQHDLASGYFGEGIVDWNDRLIGVTWQSRHGFVLNLENFKEIDTFTYEGEAWGLTRTENNIVMSDGTHRLRFLDPDSLAVVKVLEVSLRDRWLRNLNELEMVNGQLFSNVWQTNWIVRINPDSGAVTGLINLSDLLPASDRVPGHTDVLNGIAFDSESDRLFVTGKRWPKLFEIELLEMATKER